MIQRMVINRICLVISSLALGGAQRVLITMANYWAGKGINVILITFDDGSIPPVYDLVSEVNHILLKTAGVSTNLLRGIWNNLKRMFVLRKLIRNNYPDIAISFLDMTNVVTLLATRRLGLPVIVMEMSDPAMIPLGFCWEKLRLWTYPWASQVGVLSKKAQTYFPAGIQAKSTIIPNPIFLEQLEDAKEETFRGPTVITMGRLSEEKRIDILLQAFALLKDQYPNWSLVILGEGPLRVQMESLRDRLGLSTQVHFKGLVKNPHQILKRSDLYVLSSRFEGFPMALCEAMALGLAVISTEYHDGVKDIINDGVNGVLVPVENIKALAMAMDRLMRDSSERKRLGTKAKDITHRYGLEKVMRMWEELIDRVQCERKG